MFYAMSSFMRIQSERFKDAVFDIFTSPERRQLSENSVLVEIIFNSSNLVSYSSPETDFKDMDILLEN